MIRFALAVLIGLLLGGVIHFAVVLAVPRVAAQRVESELAPFMEPGRFGLVAESARIEGLDPNMRYAVCAFDVSSEPFRFVANLTADYWAMSLHAPSGGTFYTINSRAADRESVEILLTRRGNAPVLRRALEGGGEGRLIVEAWSPRGFAIIRALVASPSVAATVERGLRVAECGPLRESPAAISR